MNLLARLASRKNSALRQVAQIAAREANGAGEAKDDEKFVRALQEVDVDPARHVELIKVFERLPALREEAERLPALEETTSKTVAAIDEHVRETARILKEREQHLFELYQRVAELRGSRWPLLKAHVELQILELRYPVAMGIETPIDLDRFNLMTYPENQLPSVLADYEAPPRYVDDETFDREYARRKRIFEQAKIKTFAEHEAAVDRWRAEQPKDRLGRIISDVPPPVLRLPTWREILERGWHKLPDAA